MGEPRTILITGTSSGFGLLTARTLVTRGHTVLATMRDAEGRNAAGAGELRDFAAGAPGRLHVLELDVSSEASVETAIGRALEIAGGIDVVVNNAGIGVGGHTEAFTLDQFRSLFEVNVFGVQRVNRAVLPSMRRAGSGLLIHVSSVMGRIVIPFGGPYTATKWALEGLAESYAHELRGTGVEVAIVEPGAFPTGVAERVLSPADEARTASYGTAADAPKKMWAGLMAMLEGAGAPDPQEVADAIVGLIEMPAGQRPLRTVVDPLMGGTGPATLNKTTDRIQSHLLRSLEPGSAE